MKPLETAVQSCGLSGRKDRHVLTAALMTYVAKVAGLCRRCVALVQLAVSKEYVDNVRVRRGCTNEKVIAGNFLRMP